MKRSAFTNALFCLLLSLAAALFALSAGLWYSVYRTEQSLEDTITTIAMPDMTAIRRQSQVISERRDFSMLPSIDASDESSIVINNDDGGRIIIKDGREIIYVQPDGEEQSFEISPGHLHYYLPSYVQEAVMRIIDEKVYNSDNFNFDDRRIYGAYVDGLRSVAIQLNELFPYDHYIENLPQSAVVFIGKCTEVIELYQFILEYRGSDGRFNYRFNRAHIGRFDVEQEIYLHEGRRATKIINAYFPFSNPDGSRAIEEGKRYLLSGRSYAQGDLGPTWYANNRDVFPSNIRITNALYMDTIGRNDELEVVGTFNEFRDLPNDISITIAQNIRFDQPDTSATIDYNSSDYFPMDIREWVPKVDETLGHEGLTWFEINGSLEEALASENGKQIEDALSVARISVNSLQVLTTNDVNSLFRFNQRVNKIVQGRTLNDRDNETGAPVCIISEYLAEENGLSIGDKLPLQLYATELGQVETSSAESAWVPSLYHPGLEMTEPIEFEIVGIYSGVRQEMRDHTISPNTVIIPASSFEGVDGAAYSWLGRTFDPPILKTLIVPNNEVEETKAQLDEIAEGFSTFFRFFDQGYARLIPIIENLYFGMSWILALSIVGWAVSLVMFLLFYVGRRVKDMSLLYGLGVSKGKCFMWVFTQCFVLILISHGVVLAAMLPVYENILESALYLSSEFTDIYRNFTLSNMNIAGGIRFTLPLDNTPMGLVYSAGVSVIILLISSSVIIARATKNRWQSGREVG